MSLERLNQYIKNRGKKEMTKTKLMKENSRQKMKESRSKTTRPFNLLQTADTKLKEEIKWEQTHKLHVDIFKNGVETGKTEEKIQQLNFLKYIIKKDIDTIIGEIKIKIKEINKEETGDK